MPTPEQIHFIDARFNQLVAVSKDAIERALKYLFLSNAGGAAATLSFLGAVPAMRTQWALKGALAFFVVGLILVGVHTAIWVHFTDWLFMSLRSDVTKLFQNQIAWETMMAEDAKRAAKTTWLYASGYLAFGCFIAGAAIGLLCSSF